MIPYISQPTFSIGSVEFHLFGLLATIGLVLGVVFLFLRAKKLGIGDDIQLVLGWGIPVGFLFCIILTTVFYFPERISERGISAFFDLRGGMSSFGVFFGGGLAAWIYFRIRNIPYGRHSDILLQGLVVVWVFVRLGCTFAHDHIGNPSDFILAFDYPSGSRHNLGFYEFLFMLLVLLPITMRWRNEAHRPLLYSALLGCAYGLFRFGLDFLRASDLRHFGLTIAQGGSLVLVLAGIVLIVKWKRNGSLSNF
jgi:phosphatidylglycerol:prolipoprotein diacylglycerol transferase